MKKDHYEQDRDNIILFPNLKQRLYEKGMAHLQENQFVEATELLGQAIQIDPDDALIATSYLIALCESGDDVEARAFAEELLHKGIGDYYEIIDIYIMILIQTNEYDDVIHTIEALMEEKAVPEHKLEHFSNLLQLSKKMKANEKITNVEQKNPVEIQPHVFKELDLQEQMIQLGSLMDKNIHYYLESLLQMLADDQTHPFLQTIILNVLREHKITTPVTVLKLQRQGEFIPTDLLPLQEIPLFTKIYKELKHELEHHNPVLLQQIKDIMDRHAFILYPFDLIPINPYLWTAAYRSLGYELYGEDWSKETVAEHFEIEVGELEEAIAFLHTLEQISSPIV